MAKKHVFDFDKSMSLTELKNRYGIDNPKVSIKTCTPTEYDAEDPESPQPFNALMIENGELLPDGRSSFTFFSLSKKLTEDGVVLTREWLKENLAKLRFQDPEDLGTKFGVIYLEGGNMMTFEDFFGIMSDDDN